MTRSSFANEKICFTADQKSKLYALFRKNKYPSRKEKAALAIELDVPLEKVMVCLKVNFPFPVKVIPQYRDNLLGVFCGKMPLRVMLKSNEEPSTIIYNDFTLEKYT